MGAWGAGSFENDDAADWLADFCDEPDEKRIANALSTVAEMDAGEYLEAPECSVGLAAAEIVASLKGAGSPDLPEEAPDFAGLITVLGFLAAFMLTKLGG